MKFTKEFDLSWRKVTMKAAVDSLDGVSSNYLRASTPLPSTAIPDRTNDVRSCLALVLAFSTYSSTYPAHNLLPITQHPTPTEQAAKDEAKEIRSRMTLELQAVNRAAVR